MFLAFVAVSAILLGFIDRITQRQLDADAAALVNAERDVIVEVYDREGPRGAQAVITAELRVPGRPLVMRLEAPDGSRLAGNIATGSARVPADGRLHRGTLLRAGRTTSEPFAVTAAALDGGYRLVVGRSLKEEKRITDTLATSLLTAIGLALFLALGISFLLTRIIATRVQAIADVAGAVAAGDLSRRIKVPSERTGDAFDRLGVALNAMLARIETLLDELRSVTDGLAHDLRSPLTRMKARIDRLARAAAENSDESAAAAIAAVGAEADALLAMLDNSLEISRLEAGIGRDAFSHIDLAALVHDMAEMYGPLAEDTGVQLTALAPTAVPVLAHRELLGRALSNLIDNALRYGSAGGIIEVEAMPTAGGAQLIVADHGPGISSEDREAALRRFGRLDVARSASGAGLGLSLADSIARLHGGGLALTGNNPGLRVIINLPATQA